jgi:hypothetical protein
MTQPAPETLEREADKLFVTDAELIRRLGVPEKTMRAVLREWDEKPGSGFPKPQKLLGDRRYWPAVKAYFDRIYGTVPAPQQTKYEGRRV